MIATETIARETFAAQPGDSVTVARCNSDKLAAKTHGPSSSRSYGAGWSFAFRSIPATSVLDLFELVSAAMAHPRLFVVHGEPLVSVGRRLHAGRHGEHVTLRAKPTRVFWLDLEPADAPPDLDVTDAQAVGSYLRSSLSVELCHAACVCQLTGSAGIKPGIRARLVFWLDRAISLAQAKCWAARQPIKCDLSIYTPSQPIYTAAPVFIDGREDPVRGPRVVLLEAVS